MTTDIDEAKATGIFESRESDEVDDGYEADSDNDLESESIFDESPIFLSRTLIFSGFEINVTTEQINPPIEDLVQDLTMLNKKSKRY